MKNNILPILNIVVGTAFLSILFISGKYMGLGDKTGLIIFIRFLSGTMCLAFLALTKPRIIPTLKMNGGNHPRMRAHIGRSLTGGLGGMAMIYAPTQMPIASASAISLLDVVFMILLSMIIFKERLNTTKMIGGALCVFGAIVVVTQDLSSINVEVHYFPITIALAGALLVAIEGLFIKKISSNQGSFASLFWSNFFGTILFAPFLLQIDATILGSHYYIMLALGPITLAGQYLYYLAYRNADISIVSPITYIWIVYASLIGWAFFDEAITIYIIVGSALIIFGGVYLSTNKRTIKLASAKY